MSFKVDPAADWEKDNAASGPRMRVWFDARHGASLPCELIVYDDGRWEFRRWHTVASGKEQTWFLARKRVILVCEAYEAII